MEREEHQTRPASAHAPAPSEDLLTGGQLLLRAFLETTPVSATRDRVIITADTPEPPALMIHRGVAFQSAMLADGRRSIADILLPMDIVGLHHAVLARCDYEIVAANAVNYRLLPPAKVRELMRDPRVALRAFSLIAQSQRRISRHLMQLTRSDARGRLAAMILGAYERLRRRDLVRGPTFDLPLTQEHIADHLGLTTVHVSRTLRRLREERLVVVDRQCIIILDVEELRRAAAGLPASAELHRRGSTGETLIPSGGDTSPAGF